MVGLSDESVVRESISCLLFALLHEHSLSLSVPGLMALMRRVNVEWHRAIATASSLT